jgi:hypothetical protein
VTFLARTAVNYREARRNILIIKFIIRGIFGNKLRARTHARTEARESQSLFEYFCNLVDIEETCFLVNERIRDGNEGSER